MCCLFYPRYRLVFIGCSPVKDASCSGDVPDDQKFREAFFLELEDYIRQYGNVR